MTDPSSVVAQGLPNGLPLPADLTFDYWSMADERARTLIADRGVSSGLDRSWSLSCEPLLFQPGQWPSLERGIKQRAELSTAILADIYGDQKLLHDNQIPPAALLSDPRYLRQTLSAPAQLLFTAADLLHHDGKWYVVNQQVDNPAGIGYAMEDRRIVAQAAAEAYRRTPIARLGPYFQTLRRAVHRYAPTGIDEPRAVLLSAAGETEFDQANLAAMLGLPVVHSSDLMVREDRVWLRGLAGREQVHVIVRRIGGQLVDPVELDQTSTCGVPGLLQAIRAGTVTVANPVGAGVLEAPALLAFLPRLARTVLGTDLLLPSPRSWWCGDPEQRRQVLPHLQRLLLHRAGTVIAGWRLTNVEKTQLQARIEREPWAWTAQLPLNPDHHTLTLPHQPAPSDGDACERTELSDAPTRDRRLADDRRATDNRRLADDRRATGPGGTKYAVGVTLRTFTVVDTDGTHQVMAGGLGRSSDLWPLSATATAHDVWVLAGQTTTVDEAQTTQPSGRRPGLSPRGAQNLYWLGRYLERAEHQARLLRVVVDRLDDNHLDGAFPPVPRSTEGLGGGSATVDQVTWVLLTLARTLPPPHDSEVSHTFHVSNPASAGGGGLRALVFDQTAPTSIAYCARQIRVRTQLLRDQLSPDAFIPLARIDRALSAQTAHEPTFTTQPTRGLRPVLHTVVEALTTTAGIASEGLLRDTGWYLLDVGRRLERAQHLVNDLSVLVGPEVSEPLIDAVLTAHESVLTHRRHFQTAPTPGSILHVLVFDPSNPRSLRFSLERLAQGCSQLPVATPDLHRVLNDLVDLVSETPATGLGSIAELLESVRWRLLTASQEIVRTHLTGAGPLQHQVDQWGAQ